MIFKALNRLDKVFLVSIIFKALDGLLEAAGGVFLLLLKPDTINRFAQTLTQHELSADPHDFIATHILHSAHALAAGGGFFAAVYLLSHGLTKIVLVFEILREKLWAYKAMVIFLGIFIVYQLYRMIDKFSVGLLLLTLFDGLIIYLTLREEKRQRKYFETKE